MRKGKKGPEDIKGILNKLIVKIKKKNPARRERILKAWGKIVGEKASCHSRPTNVRRKALTIEVDSSSWLYELSLKKRNILSDLKKELKEEKIEDIRFRMGDIA